MALKFQYNKTTIQELRKQLSIREKALPILQNKEMALRKEVKERLKKLHELKEVKELIYDKIYELDGLWAELPRILFIDNANIVQEKIIGVKVPSVKTIDLKMADFCWWHYPAWLPRGIELLKKALIYDITAEILERQVQILDRARKKTTQKVNLYEKVQIPEMNQAILKVKRFLEDKENISKAGQKIMKEKKKKRREAA